MIRITGDTHGEFGNLYRTCNGLTEDDYVIVLGDFGFIWDESTPNKLNKICRLRPTILFIDGNHENFDIINNRVIKNWNGGKVHVFKNINDKPKIIHLMRGQQFIIENKSFFTFGGAESIDKDWRTPFISWWTQEEPTHEEFEIAQNTLEKYNYKFDYILTHTCPSELLANDLGTYKKGTKRERAQNKFFSMMHRQVEFKDWFFGHFHGNEKIIIDNKSYQLLYHDTIDL